MNRRRDDGFAAAWIALATACAVPIVAVVVRFLMEGIGL